MLCPETWRFAPPKSIYKEHTYTKTNKKTGSESDKQPSVLSHFNYAHLVSVVLPNINQAPNELLQLFEDCEYYKIQDLTLSELLNKQFYQKFIKHGDLSALSINTKLDLDNCVCVTNGTLVLHLDKRSYEELGVEGKLSHFSNKYIIHLSLDKHSNKKQQKALKERLNKFTLIISWQPPSVDICPSSIAKYFADLGYGVSLCTPKHSTQLAQNINVPNYPKEPDSPSELLEWLGMFSLDAGLNNNNEQKNDDYVNSYEVPEDNSLCKHVIYLRRRGFYGSIKLQQIYEYLIKYVQTLDNNELPWISLYVQGFSDAPVAWDLTENHYFTNADNACAFFFKPNGEYLLCEHKCSNKKYTK